MHAVRKTLSTLALAGLGVFAVGVGSLGAVAAAPHHADSVSHSEHIRSECGDLWMHEQDMRHPRAVEDRCRAEGWHIGWRFNLSPNGQRIWTGYGPCAEEDSLNCYWNARTMGNGHGESFVTWGTPRHWTTYYVTRINGHKA